MIVKQADDKQPQLDILRDLLTHPDADAGTKKRIEQEIRNIQAGTRETLCLFRSIESMPDN